jgi:CheY-like chemotaxis protein
LEDCEINKGILHFLLTSRNHEVFAYDNPSICPLQKTPECRCTENEKCSDIIISDLNMPFINGLEYIQNQRIKGCKCENVALITNELNPDVKKKAEKLSCKVFSKPYQVMEIFGWLDEVEKDLNRDTRLAEWYKEA